MLDETDGSGLKWFTLHLGWAGACAIWVVMTCSCSTELRDGLESSSDSSRTTSTGHLQTSNRTIPRRKDYLRIRKTVSSIPDSLHLRRYHKQFLEILARDSSDPLAHYGLSLIFRILHNDSLALVHLKQTIATDPPDPLVYHTLADVARIMGELPRTVEWLRGLQAAGSVSRPVILGLGILYAELHEWRKAENFARHLIDDQNVGGDASLLLARTARATGRYESALYHAEKAESIAIINQDMELLVRSFDSISMVRRLSGELPGSVDAAEKALAFARKETLGSLEAPILTDLGFLYMTLGDLDAAEGYLEKAVSRARALGDRTTESWAVKFNGDILYAKGECERAKRMHDEAIFLMSSVNDPEGSAASFNALANDLSCLGDLNGALRTYAEALELNRSLGNKSGEASVLANMAYTYLEKGNLGRAMVSFHDAIRKSEEQGDFHAVAEWSLGKGNVLIALGDTARARNTFEAAVNAAAGIQSLPLLARALTSLGVLAFKAGDFAVSKWRLTRALDLFLLMEDQTMISVAHQNLATMYLAAGNVDTALIHAESTLAIARATDNPLLEAHALVTRGEIALESGKTARAREYFTHGLKRAGSLPSPDVLSMAYYGIARSHESEENHKTSIPFYENALSELERTRRSVVLEHWSYGFLSRRIKLYEDYIHLLARLHREDPNGSWHIRAFEVAERAKARAFSDLLMQPKEDTTTLEKFSGDSERRRLVRALSGTARSLWERTRRPDEMERLRRQFFDYEDQLARLEFGGRTRGREGTEASAAGLPEITSLPGILEAAGIDVLLEYFLADEESYLWTVTPEGFSFKNLPSKYVIRDALRLHCDEVARPPRFASTPLFTSSLVSGMILDEIPIPDTGVIRIVVVPDDHLFYLPFETLPLYADGDSTRIMLDAAVVSYLPSAATMSLLKRNISNSPGGPVVSVGISHHAGAEYGFDLNDLPYAEDEAEMVCRTLSPLECILLTGPAACEEGVRTALSQPCRILHLATHTLADPKKPRRSCVVLAHDPDGSEDDIFTMDEIARMPHGPGIAILSTCESGIGELISGEGMISLSRAFFYSGAQTVIVSLWPINDRSTMMWMAKFYESVSRGALPDEAARYAKRSFLNEKDGALRHPYYWAPYIVIGGLWSEPGGLQLGESHE